MRASKAVWVVLLVSGCGTSGGSGSDASTDAASETSAPGDAGTDAVPPATLAGAQGFSVAFTWIDLGLPPLDCGFTDTTADGGIAAAAVELFEKDYSQLSCGTGGTPTASKLLQIGIATPEYAGGKYSNLTQAITPGDYPIGMPSDVQPFCSFASGTTAFLQVGSTDDSTTNFAWYGASGTVTVTSATSTSIAGTFTTQLTDTGGANEDGGTLTGTFAASTCP